VSGVSENREKFAALMHVAFGLVGEAMGWPTRNVRAWLALKSGHCDAVRWPSDSARLFVPHSMADMTRAELEVFWDDAREIIRREVIPYVDARAGEEIGFRIDDLRNVS